MEVNASELYEIIMEKDLDTIILEELDKIQAEANRLEEIQKVHHFWRKCFKKYQKDEGPLTLN